MGKKRRKPKGDSYRSKRKAWIVQFEGELKSIMRQAARVGAAEAIEHCGNFWNVSDGYKKYIDHQITSQAEALMAAVRKVVTELILVQNSRRKR